MVPKLTKKQQDKQIKKEAVICILVYILFFIWWLVTGYGLGIKGPEEYPYVFGLPLWFVLSSLVGTVLFFAATIVVVKCLFKDFDLEQTADEEEEQND